MLVYPDLNKPYNLDTDISNSAVGACLTQTQFDQVAGKEIKKILFLISAIK